MGANAEDDARERRDAWIAAGAPDYNAPTTNDSGETTGYQSVADQSSEQRSAENQNLPDLMKWLGAGAPDYAKPILDANKKVVGYQSVTATDPQDRSASIRNLERLLSGMTSQILNQPGTPKGQQPGRAQAVQPLPASNAGGYSNDVASELAARYYAAQFGLPLDQARSDFFNADPNYRASALGMAQAGDLNYLLGNQATQPGTNTPGVVVVSNSQPNIMPGAKQALFYGPGDLRDSGNPNTPNSWYLPGGGGYDPTKAAGAGNAGGNQGGQQQPSPLSTGNDTLSDLMAKLERRSKLLGLTPQAAKDRADRSLAAIYQNTPGVRELLATATDLDPTDWRGATQRWLSEQKLTDATKYAVDQGFMAPLPPRTVTDLVDETMLGILQQQGLMGPDVEANLNKELEARYQAELAGTEPPASGKPVGGSAFMPPVPSTQFWYSVLNPGEQQGVTDLFGALGYTPQMLANEIRRHAPGAGNAAAAVLGYRGR